MKTVPRRNPIILLLDENETLLEIYAKQLRVNEFEALLAKTGDEALKVFAERNVGQMRDDSLEKIRGVLLGDFHPGVGNMNGIQVADQMRSMDSEVVIMMLTGSPGDARSFAFQKEIVAPPIYPKNGTNLQTLIDKFGRKSGGKRR